MFYGHRVDTQEVDTCRGPHSPRLRWPSPLVTVGTGYGAISPLQPTSIASTWDPAPVLPGSCLGPREQRREGGAMETPGGTAPPTQSVPGPSPPVPLCSPDQPSLGSSAPRSFSPEPSQMLLPWLEGLFLSFPSQWKYTFPTMLTK